MRNRRSKRKARCTSIRHPTKFASTSDTTYLWVDGLLGQHSVALTGRLGTLPELYKITDGLRRH